MTLSLAAARPRQITRRVWCTPLQQPNMEMLEDRLRGLGQREPAAAFSSGMAAISTTLWAFASGRCGTTSEPLYGGTETLIARTLSQFGIRAVGITDACDRTAVQTAAATAMTQARESRGRVGLIMLETPANPTSGLVDIALLRATSEEIGRQQAGGRPPVAVDNTFLGPVFQRPLAHGADLSLYSLTKYVGGHSDLVAGGKPGRRNSWRRCGSCAARSAPNLIRTPPG